MYVCAYVYACACLHACVSYPFRCSVIVWVITCSLSCCSFTDGFWHVPLPIHLSLQCELPLTVLCCAVPGVWISGGALVFFCSLQSVQLTFWFLQKCCNISSWEFLSDMVMSCLFDVRSMDGVKRAFSDFWMCALFQAVDHFIAAVLFAICTLYITQKLVSWTLT